MPRYEKRWPGGGIAATCGVWGFFTSSFYTPWGVCHEVRRLLLIRNEAYR